MIANYDSQYERVCLDPLHQPFLLLHPATETASLYTIKLSFLK